MKLSKDFKIFLVSVLSLMIVVFFISSFYYINQDNTRSCKAERFFCKINLFVHDACKPGNDSWEVRGARVYRVEEMGRSQNCTFTLDNTCCYLKKEEVKNADTQTFQIIDVLFAKDKNRVYSAIKDTPMPNLDAMTFGAADKNGYYRDKNGMYHHESLGGILYSPGLPANRLIKVIE